MAKVSCGPFRRRRLAHNICYRVEGWTMPLAKQGTGTLTTCGNGVDWKNYCNVPRGTLTRQTPIYCLIGYLDCPDQRRCRNGPNMWVKFSLLNLEGIADIPIVSSSLISSHTDGSYNNLCALQLLLFSALYALNLLRYYISVFIILQNTLSDLLSTLIVTLDILWIIPGSSGFFMNILLEYCIKNYPGHFLSNCNLSRYSMIYALMVSKNHLSLTPHIGV